MKKTYIFENRTFEVSVSPDCMGAKMECDIREVVHPERRLFRTRYIATRSFWIDDYVSIDVGIKTLIGKCIQKEVLEAERCKKIAEFENRT